MEQSAQERVKSILKNIRIIREQKEYSQGYLAAKLGISQNAYSKMELGHTLLTVERLFLIAMVLETDITKLYQQGILENYDGGNLEESA
ncbi:helix-turn-helix transcriptional regulator [Mucilaginibacter sp. SMC90]|uniref:helix-turn-helix domain-containing protein n=1 Tax=Mucilaginibacter sp. SMC90 TaxID=2929803 RepID=UPI001FB2CFC0|nr:helix-turn-helix transcriptional regulator [Mucilaginibacter sp. SMC90]UOE49389.1 helix-turn-helix transcriptional regulator [Mucilaginibacter sp. SMC90]